MIQILDETFSSQDALKLRVQHIRDDYDLGEKIKPGSKHFAFLNAVMQRHPEAAEKLADLHHYEAALYCDYGKTIMGFTAHTNDGKKRRIGWVRAVKGR